MPPLPGRLVTIDGPAGSGKSSVARELAARLGWRFLDTGAMYRTVGLLGLRRGLDFSDSAAVVRAMDDAVIDFDWSQDPPRIRLDGEAVDEAIRSLDATDASSRVASMPEVRARLVEAQRRIALEHGSAGLVSEGRDQGSVVFPRALVRFFLDAPVEERAKRRVEQLESAGMAADLESIRRGIRERDAHDRARAVGPLVIPLGGVVIDTGSLSMEAVVDRLEGVVREALGSVTAARVTR